MATVDLPASFVVAKDSQKGKVYVRDLEAEKKAQAEVAASKDQKAIEAAKKEILKEIGAYEVTKDNQVKLIFTEFKEALTTDFQLALKGSYTRGPDAFEITKDSKKTDEKPFTIKILEEEVVVTKQLIEVSKADSNATEVSEGNDKTLESDKPKTQVEKKPSLLKAPAASVNSLNDKLDGKVGQENVEITFTDKNGKPIDEKQAVGMDSDINFKFTLNVEDHIKDPSKPPVKDDVYTLDLPNNLTYPNMIDPVKMLDGDGEAYAEYIIKDGKLKITVLEDGFQGGDVSFTGNLNKDKIKNPGDTTINFPNNENIPGKEFTIKPAVAAAIDKAGVPDKNHNPTQIIWTIDFNKDYQTLNGATVSDTLPKELAFNSVPQVVPLNLDLNGKVVGTGTALTKGVDYNVIDGKVVFLNEIKQPYRITYVTDIKPDYIGKGAEKTDLKLDNTAHQTSNEDPDPIDADASVNVSYPGMINKSSTKYDSNTQIYDWKIQYNYGEIPVVPGNSVTDQSTNMKLINGDPVVYPVTFDAEGNPQQGKNALDPSMYDLTKVTDEQGDVTGFTIKFNDKYFESNKTPDERRIAYNIVYQTTPDQIITGTSKDQPMKNDYHTDNNNIPPSVDVTPEQGNIIKNKPDLDSSVSMLTWTADINKNHYPVEDVIITDKSKAAGDGNMGVPRIGKTRNATIGVQINDVDNGNRLLVRDTDYKLHYFKDGQEISEADADKRVKDPATGFNNLGSYDSFSIEFMGPNYQKFTSKLKLTYYTEINTHITNTGGNKGYVFDNSQEINFTVDNKPYESNSSNEYKPNQEIADQGLKSGSYNPITKEITWKLILNYNNYSSPGLDIVDQLTGPQNLIPGSVEISRGIIDPDTDQYNPKGGPVLVYDKDKGQNWDANDQGNSYVKTDESNPKKLMVTIGQMRQPGDIKNGVKDYPNALTGWDDKSEVRKNVYQVTFRTSLDNEVISKGQEFTDENGNKKVGFPNDAVTGWNEDHSTLHADVEVKYSNESAVKNAKYNRSTGYIDWNVWLNRNQSTYQDLILKDSPSSNQAIDKDSICVYRTTIDSETGNVSVDTRASAGMKLTEGKDYVLTLTTDATTGEQHMSLDFSKLMESARSDAKEGEMKLPYYIVYSSKPLFSKATENVHNGLDIESKGNNKDNPPSNFNNNVTINTSTGNSFGAKGVLTVQKYGLNNTTKLPGIKFQLYIRDKRANSTTPDFLLREGETNDQGQLTFENLVLTNNRPESPFVYVVKEVGSQFGYTIAQEKEVKLEKGADTAVINNDLSLKIRKFGEPKADGSATSLPGAKFALTQTKGSVPGATWPKTYPEGQLSPSDDNGVYNIDLYELTSGMPANQDWQFQLTETTPPQFAQGSMSGDAYYKSNQVYKFGVKTDANQVRTLYIIDGSGNEKAVSTDDLTTFDFYNYQGKAKIYKSVDGGGSPAGAEFTAYLSNTKHEVAKGVAGNDGVVLIEGLYPGQSYDVKETKAPAGYYPSELVGSVTIPPNTAGVATVQDPFDVKFKNGLADGQIKNYRGSARFYKGFDRREYNDDGSLKNSSVRKLGGAVFVLTNAAGDPVNRNNQKLANPSQALKFTSSSDTATLGQVDIDGLMPGATYYLKEEQAPLFNGGPQTYIANTTPFKFTMPKATEAAVDSTDGDAEVVLGKNKDLMIWNFLSCVSFGKQGIPDISEPNNPVPLAGAYFELQIKDGNTWKTATAMNSEPHGAVEYEPGKWGFVSDNSGRVKAYNIPYLPGGYHFVEVKAPDGYVKTEQTLEFNLPAGTTDPDKYIDEYDLNEETKAPLINNYRGKVQLQKNKVVDGTESGLAEASFNIYHKDDDPETATPVNGDTPILSDNNGLVEYNGLESGEYFFQEIATKNNEFIVNKTKMPFTIPEASDADGWTNSEIVDAKKLNNYQGIATLEKAAEDGTPLDGAIFQLERRDNGATGDFQVYPDSANPLTITSTGGKVTTPELPPGEYRFVEIQAPLGDDGKPKYLINTEKIPFEIPLTAQDDSGKGLGLDEVYTVDAGTLTNYQGSARVLKTDQAGNPITESDATFALYKTGETTPLAGYETVVTENGYATVKNLAPGDYYFKEVASPKGYIRNSDWQGSFTIDSSADGKPATVGDPTNPNLTVMNSKGSVILTKLNDKRVPLSGVTFDLYKYPVSDGDSPIKQNIKSNPYGEVRADNLDSGQYIFRETATLPNHVINSKDSDVFEIPDETNGSDPVVIKTNIDNQPLEMINYRGNAQLIKYGPDGTTPIGGAEFQLAKDPAKTPSGKVYISNAKDGIVSFNDLAPGTYTIFEKKAPDGLIRSNKTFTFTIDAKYAGDPGIVTKANGEQVDMSLINITGSAQLIKTDANGNKLANASFNVFKEGEDPATATPINAKPIVSQGDGIIRQDNLAPGKYFFYEEAVDGGYAINQTQVPFEIPETTDQDQVLITKDLSKTDMTLKNYKASVELQKNQLNMTGDKIPLGSANFGLYKASDLVNPVQTTSSDVATGKVRFDNLEAGEAYVLKEISAPGDFQTNPDTFTFKVPTELTDEYVITKDKDDNPLELTNFMGSARMLKTDDQGKPLSTKALATAVFAVYPADNPDGAPVKSGLRADADGYVTAVNLKPGQYVFKETKAADGYLLNTSPTSKFTISGVANNGNPVEVMQDPANPTDSIKTVPLTLQNYQGSAQLKKTDEADKALGGAEFALFADPKDDQPIPNTKAISDSKTGLVTFTNLAPGTYTAKETKPAPGGFIQSEKSFTFTIANNADGKPAVKELGTIKNVKGGAELQKVNEAKDGLNGAEFNVYKKGESTPINQAPLKSQTVDGKDGIVQINDLAPGDYYFQEITRPSEYKLNNTPVDFTIPETTDSEEAVIKTGLTLTDYQGELKFTKQDADGNALKGAEFTVYDDKGAQVGSAQSSNDKGEVLFTKLAPGHYTVKETKAAPGHQQLTKAIPFVISDTGSATETVTIKSQGAANDGVVVNYQGSAQLTKKDGDAPANTLAGAIFTLYQDGKEYRKNLTVGSNGVLAVNKLEPGTYYFQETKAPAGYILNTEPSKEFTINNEADEAQLETVEVLNYRGKVELEKNGVIMRDGKAVTQALAGAEFKITSQFKPTITQTAVATKGQVNFANLAPGQYTIEETKAAAGYIRSTKTFDVTIPEKAEGQPAVIDAGVLTNVQGNVELQKNQEDGSALAEAQFGVYNKADDKEIAKAVSDDKGKVTVNNLAPGEYYFKEIKQPTGFILDPTEYPFTIPDESASEEPVMISDKALTSVNYKGNIELVKKDQDGKVLAGSEFTLNDGAGTVVKSTSDKDGKVTFTELAPGEYTLQETQATEGYQQNDTSFKVTIPATADAHVKITKDQAGKDLELLNFKGNAQLQKQDANGQPLAGAVFEVINEADGSTVNTVTSDKDGKVVVNNLAPGKYHFKEITPATGYMLNTTESATFTIDSVATESQTITKFDDGSDMTMTNYQGQIKLIKNDSESRALAGAEFTLTAVDDKGTKNVQPQRSAEDGSVIFSNLAPGKYTLAETKAPAGYIQSAQVFNVEIPESAASQPAVVETDTDHNPLILKNVKGTAILEKKDEDGQALADANFSVYDANDEEVKTAISAKDGKVTVTDLAPGKYYFKETKQPTGYLLNDTKVEFEIPAVDEGKEEAVVVTTDLNQKDMTLQNFKGRAEITKVDEAGKQLAGAEFTLIDANGETIKTLTTDETGKVLFEDLAPGKYSVKETKAPAGYQLNPTVMNLEIPAETDQAIVITKDQAGQALQLTNYQGQAELQKQDAQGKALAGVEFALYDKAGKVVQEHLLSDADGKVQAAGLAPGTYYFKETRAVAGYILNTEPSGEFTISDQAKEAKVIKTDDQGKALTMTNYQGRAQLVKTDSTGKQVLKNAVFKLVNETGGTVKANLITDANGMITVDGLAPGKYSFVETMAPTGYQLDSLPVDFTIAAEAKGEPMTVKLTKQNKLTPSTNRFPKTGATQAFWAIPTGIGMIGLADAIQRKRKKATKK